MSPYYIVDSESWKAIFAIEKAKKVRVAYKYNVFHTHGLYPDEIHDADA